MRLPRRQLLASPGRKERHHAWIRRFWEPDAEASTALGRMYLEDERFTTTIDRHEPGLAAYLRDAMAVYARATLR
ncbi:TipAS antibiotic-recognition domain-containing protein [Pseudonocardia sp. RS010]|uniref:TipAS antibiotic-recognition domain-containing protein n=1 Tax=Pseudonocardia sp. RS010 TaxID=3385979 RepID=UPI0039A2D979